MLTAAKNTVDAKCGLGFEGAGQSEPKKNLSNDISKMADLEFERNKLAQSAGQAHPRIGLCFFSKGILCCINFPNIVFVEKDLLRK